MSQTGTTTTKTYMNLVQMDQSGACCFMSYTAAKHYFYWPVFPLLLIHHKFNKYIFKDASLILIFFIYVVNL